MTKHSQRPQRDNTDLDKFFAEADDILEHWHGGTDANEWHADGSHQPARISGDYYLDDEPAGVAARRREHPRNGGGLFRPYQRAQDRPDEDDPGWFTPGYEDLVMRWWLADVWYAGLFGIIERNQAENIRNGFPNCSTARDLDMLISYVARHNHRWLVTQTDQALAVGEFAMEAAAGEDSHPLAVMFPNGHLHVPGVPLDPPSWAECLLPVPASRNDIEFVRQAYLHSWAIVRQAGERPQAVLVEIIEKVIRSILALQLEGYRLPAGLHGGVLATHRDEARATLSVRMRLMTSHPEHGTHRHEISQQISDEQMSRSRRLERYDLPLLGVRPHEDPLHPWRDA